MSIRDLAASVAAERQWAATMTFRAALPSSLHSLQVSLVRKAAAGRASPSLFRIPSSRGKIILVRPHSRQVTAAEAISAASRSLRAFSPLSRITRYLGVCSRNVLLIPRSRLGVESFFASMGFPQMSTGILRTVSTGTVAAMVLCSPAAAGWQFTEWGMTPEQVLAAGRGKAQPMQGSGPASDGSIAKVKVDHVVQGITLTASLLFDRANKLKFVQMSGRNTPDCTTIGAILRNTYGRSESSSDGKWRDAKRVNLVTFVNFGSLCILQYERIPSPGAPGGL